MSLHLFPLVQDLRPLLLHYVIRTLQMIWNSILLHHQLCLQSVCQDFKSYKHGNCYRPFLNHLPNTNPTFCKSSVYVRCMFFNTLAQDLGLWWHSLWPYLFDFLWEEVIVDNERNASQDSDKGINFVNFGKTELFIVVELNIKLESFS